MKIEEKIPDIVADELAVHREHIVKQVIGRLEMALRNGDCDLWTKTIYSEDDIANEAQRIWFEGYILNPNAYNVSIKTHSIVSNFTNVIVDCYLQLEYEKFNPVKELHRYTIEFIHKLGDWRITWLEKVPASFETDWIKGHKPFDLTVKSEADNEIWWENESFINLVREAKDPLSPLVYARAIPRNIRFREAHPMIECAALLVNMMSMNTLQLASQIFDSNKLQMLANLYNASRDRIFIRLVRPDRDNTWASKYLAPWYGIDEMVSSRNDDGIIIGNCSPVMSLYFAILRLGGFKFGDLYQLRMNNQDVVLVSIDSQVYLLSSDKLVELTDKTLYHNTRVTKVYNDRWIWTSLGLTNIPEAMQKQLSDWFIKNIPNFRFPDEVKDSGLASIFKPESDLPSLLNIHEPILLSRKIKEYILKASNEYPESSYTWAKYGYQTLYVPKPETYAVWSLQSPLMQEFVKGCSNFDHLITVLKEYKKESIFVEADRIMTADQVIRNKRGDYKSLALFMYTWFVLRDNKEGLVLITSKCYYCGWLAEGIWKFWDIENEKEVSTPKGKIILAFDNKYSYYPMSKAISQMEPSWLMLLVN
ncbi:MAG TPA: hypothetical protein VIO64_19400 [Pseudobacteroides sp.]|uniref:hypothetical protein n=1 Tax=Pseudobacteroides sp. TaxID=1968840 RepID=UPI002F933FA4